MKLGGPSLCLRMVHSKSGAMHRDRREAMAILATEIMDHASQVRGHPLHLGVDAEKLRAAKAGCCSVCLEETRNPFVASRSTYSYPME
jgi:hypothetical protein